MFNPLNNVQQMWGAWNNVNPRHTGSENLGHSRIIFTTNLDNLISQPEPPVGGGEAIGVNVVDEDVGEAVLRVRLVTQREAESLPGTIAAQNHLLQRQQRRKS